MTTIPHFEDTTEKNEVGSSSAILVIIAIAVVLLIDIIIFCQRQQDLFTGASDFSGFYAAGAIVDRGEGHLVYDYGTERRMQAQFTQQLSFRKGPLLFTHAPFELILFAPLALLSYDHALTVWYILNAIGVLTIPFLIRRYVPFVRSELPYAVLALGFFLPITMALIQGQDSIALVILLTLVFTNLQEGREIRSGCILALATFKPQLVLPLLLVMVVTRRWRFVLGFVSGCFVLCGVSMLLVGWRTSVYYPIYLVQFDRLPAAVSDVYPTAMPNIRGLVYALFGGSFSPPTLKIVVVVLSAIPLLLLLLWSLRDPEPSSLHLSFIVLITVLTSYYIYPHDAAILILSIYVLADYVSGRSFTLGRIAVTVSIGALFVAPCFGMPALTMAPALLMLAITLFLELPRKRLRMLASTPN